MNNTLRIHYTNKMQDVRVPKPVFTNSPLAVFKETNGAFS